MANRLFNAAVLGSAALALVTVAAWLVAGRIDPRRNSLSLSPDCHISVGARGVDARLQVFNDSDYGPYGGSIVGFTEDPNRPVVSGFGDRAGIYYRRIQWPGGGLLWTLQLSLAYPLAVFSLLPILWVRRRLKRTS